MKSTSLVWLCVAALGCQQGEGDKAKAAPASKPAGALVMAANSTPEYAADIGKLCDVIRLSGAPDDDAQTLTTANWLAENLTTADSRKFLVSIQPLQGPAKADALDAEAKRVGLPGCALSAVWRKPAAVAPM